MFDFEAFWRNWLGQNETVATVASARRRSLKAIAKEIAVQEKKKTKIENEIKNLETDKRGVVKTLADLRSEQTLLTRMQS